MDERGVGFCEPQDAKEKGAGFLIAPQPNSATLKVLRPSVAYNQMDGDFQTTGGSEPAYNLSSYLMTQYKNNREVTFITLSSGGHAWPNGADRVGWNGQLGVMDFFSAH